MTFGQTQNVMEYEHLSGAAGPRPAPDRRYAQGISRSCSQFGRNAFQHESKAAGLLQTLRIIKQAQGIIGFPALHLEPAHDVDALGGETEMSHDRNFAVDQGTYHFDTFGTTLEFDSISATLEEPPAFRIVSSTPR
ncbi:hypothetical protein XI07_04985 [Bradyrhizobium sp. CCBAU 11445]|nr:hypothetical protein [Bradyrhizobium sp. CCBAU 11445]